MYYYQYYDEIRPLRYNYHGIYLGAYTAEHPNYDIVYQDINGKRDLAGDMLLINLDPYDFIICTPPCNYWSHALADDRKSSYSFATKHLLPEMLKKLRDLKKPFIIENVRNDPKFEANGLFQYRDVYVYRIGRHTYWTNRSFNTFIAQDPEDIVSVHTINRQGGKNVHAVIEKWLYYLHMGFN